MKKIKDFKNKNSKEWTDMIFLELKLMEDKIIAANTLIQGYIIAILSYVFAIKAELDKINHRDPSKNFCLQGVFATISNLNIIKGSILLLNVATMQLHIEHYKLLDEDSKEVIIINTEVAEGIGLFVISYIIQLLGTLLIILNNCKCKDKCKYHHRECKKENSTLKEDHRKTKEEAVFNLLLSSLDIIATIIIINYVFFLILSSLKAQEIELNKLNGKKNALSAPYIETLLALISKRGILTGGIILAVVIFMRLLLLYNDHKSSSSKSKITQSTLIALGLVLYVRSYTLQSTGVEEKLWEKHLNVIKKTSSEQKKK